MYKNKRGSGSPSTHPTAHYNIVMGPSEMLVSGRVAGDDFVTWRAPRQKLTETTTSGRDGCCATQIVMLD